MFVASRSAPPYTHHNHNHATNDNTQYIRKEETDGRQESVMMEADGPGAIVRFWLTA